MSEAVVVGWERALMEAEKVKQRLRRATKALDGAGVSYAVVGGNAVAEWVARIDDEAVRTFSPANRRCTPPLGLPCGPSMNTSTFSRRW